MERKINYKVTKEEIFLYLIFTVGIFGHLFEPLLKYMKTLTPYTLFITGSVVFLSSLKNSFEKLIIWATLTYILTFTLEVIGAKTGIIFGNYWYGETLGIKLSGVPLIIGFNWVMVILGAIIISKWIFKQNFLIALSTAVLAVLFDFFLEPAAIKLGYWYWENNIIPLQNYLAWFVIAFLFAHFYLKINVKVNSSIPAKYFIVQLIFFLALFAFMR